MSINKYFYMINKVSYLSYVYVSILIVYWTYLHEKRWGMG